MLCVHDISVVFIDLALNSIVIATHCNLKRDLVLPVPEPEYFHCRCVTPSLCVCVCVCFFALQKIVFVFYNIITSKSVLLYA